MKITHERIITEGKTLHTLTLEYDRIFISSEDRANLLGGINDIESKINDSVRIYAEASTELQKLKKETTNEK